MADHEHTHAHKDKAMYGGRHAAQESLNTIGEIWNTKYRIQKQVSNKKDNSEDLKTHRFKITHIRW